MTALALGTTEAELVDDANLAAMCEACNLGLGPRSLYPATHAAIMYRIVLAEEVRARPEAPMSPPSADAVGSSRRELSLTPTGVGLG